MEIMTSTGFISNLVLMVLISVIVEFLDKGKTFGGFFVTRLAGVRGAVFATWLVICGIAGAIANVIGGQSGGMAAAVGSLLVGAVLLAFIAAIDRVSPCQRHKWTEEE